MVCIHNHLPAGKHLRPAVNVYTVVGKETHIIGVALHYSININCSPAFNADHVIRKNISGYLHIPLSGQGDVSGADTVINYNTGGFHI